MVRRYVLAVGCAAAALGPAGCGGDDGGGGERTAPPRPQAPALQEAWSVAPGQFWNAPPASTSAWAWTTDTALVVPGKRSLTAYAADSGEEQWTTELPRAVCAIARAPNEAGVGAVLLSGGTEVNSEACGSVAAIDTATGELLWTTSLRGTSSYGLTDVEIGPDAVAVTNPCDRALTFSVRDGEELASWPERDAEGCVHTYASDGRIVVDGDESGDREAFVGYDAASGKRLWSAPVAPAAGDGPARPEVARVISSDPVVIDASTSSHRFLFHVNAETSTATPFGREANDSFVPVFTQLVGGRVVVQYGESPILFAYDPLTGDEVSRTVLGPGESAFGVRDGLVVSAGSVADTALADAGLQVRSTDPVTGEQQVLGTGRLDGVAATFGRGTGFDVALAGSTMVLRTTDALVGYRLPEQGPAASAVDRPPRLGPDELTREQAVSLCTGVTEETKAALGFADPALPAPANCEWVEQLDGGEIRQMRVTALALAPGRGMTATQAAQRNVAQLSEADELNEFPPLTPLAGLGDEAASGRSTGERLPVARVVARVDNVVILVDVIGSSASSARGEERRVAERGARAAAADLVAEVERRR